MWLFTYLIFTALPIATHKTKHISMPMGTGLLSERGQAIVRMLSAAVVTYTVIDCREQPGKGTTWQRNVSLRARAEGKPPWSWTKPTGARYPADCPPCGESQRNALAIQFLFSYHKGLIMPISLRLPPDIETRIAGFGSRAGLTKSAVIVRSIEEFLARHAQPSSQQIYEEAMRTAVVQRGDAKVDPAVEAREQRPLKLQLRKAIRNKHAARSERATQVLASRQDSGTPSR